MLCLCMTRLSDWIEGFILCRINCVDILLVSWGFSFIFINKDCRFTKLLSGWFYLPPLVYFLLVYLRNIHFPLNNTFKLLNCICHSLIRHCVQFVNNLISYIISKMCNNIILTWLWSTPHCPAFKRKKVF